MKQETRNLIGLLACVALIATLLGGCPASPVYAQPPGPEPTTCEECRTDAECERLCGGEYGYGFCEGHPPRCPLPPGSISHPTPFCLCTPGGSCGWVCPGGSR